MKKLVDAGASLYDVDSDGDTALTTTCFSENDTMENQHIALFFSQKPLQRELSAMKREMKALKERDAAAQGIGAMSISDDSKLSGMYSIFALNCCLRTKKDKIY